LLKTEDEAKSVIAELKKGADFAELAKKRSTDPGAANGGDLGWFTAATTVKPFADAVQAMKVGTYSEEPVQTQFGWHVILLEDRKEDEAPSLDAVREEMRNAANQKKVDAYIAALKKPSGSASE
jgi:peptidyl-prolyl cis-trans isomerase C